jgi:hypothetical protein
VGKETFIAEASEYSMHVNAGIALPNRLGGRPQLIIVSKVKQK